MKNRKVFWSAILITLFFSSSCSTYENEKNISIEASEKFYEEFNEGKFHDISENIIDSSLTNLRRDNLVKRLQIIKNAFGLINGKNLKKTEVRFSDENSTIISCTYQINTENDGVNYQELIWRVDKESVRLRDTLTFSFNSKGEMQLIFVDGKIIL